MGNNVENRKKTAFKKYFGSNPHVEDVFGCNTFP